MTKEEKKLEKAKKNKSKKEGRRVRSLDPMHYVGIYLMDDRTGASNYFTGTLDIAVAEEYVKSKREQGMKDFSIMHLYLAAFVRMYSQHPQMNRFIRGHRIYARNNIEIAMTIKKEMKLNADDTVIKLVYPHESTAEEVYRITQKVIADALAEDGDFDGTVKILNKIPRCVMRVVAWFIKKLDYYGILPKSLVSISPFHGSMVITSLASLGIPPIYHHLYDFGNVPVFMSFGAKKHRYELQSDGTTKHVPYVSYTVVMDERTVDGFYYASALRYMNRIYRNPWMLDERPETIAEDIP